MTNEILKVNVLILQTQAIGQNGHEKEQLSGSVHVQCTQK